MKKIFRRVKQKKRSFLIDTTNEATGLIRLKAGSRQRRNWSLRHKQNQKHRHYLLLQHRRTSHQGMTHHEDFETVPKTEASLREWHDGSRPV